MSPRRQVVPEDVFGGAEVPNELEWATERGEQREAVSNLKADVAYLRAELAKVSTDINHIKVMLATNRGGIRMLLSVGAIAASLGATIAEIIHWWHR
jgi:hypothetical protein